MIRLSAIMYQKYFLRGNFEALVFYFVFWVVIWVYKTVKIEFHYLGLDVSNYYVRKEFIEV